MRAFQWLNYHSPEHGMFTVTLRYTGLVDLPHIDEFDRYIDTIRTLRRRQYRRAHREGFAVEDSEDVDTLQALHEKTFARQGLPRSEREVQLLTSIATSAVRKGFGTICVVRRPGEPPVGATLFLHDARKCYYLIGANDPDYRNTGASDLLFLEHMRRYAERGIRVLDVVGINSPQRGDYKTSFNAAPAAYYRAELRCGAG
jgi:lipid II:glycine glycyltransferase (peptidoglycan interpeptide bridge formation enzyme)